MAWYGEWLGMNSVLRMDGDWTGTEIPYEGIFKIPLKPASFFITKFFLTKPLFWIFNLVPLRKKSITTKRQRSRAVPVLENAIRGLTVTSQETALGLRW